MVVFKRKTRMISFRLSEEEYTFLHQASLSTGARSISDFARDALFRLLRDRTADPGAPALAARMEQLAADLQSVNGELERLRSLVSQPVHSAE